jgi:uncharacterized membrane protein YsdA (DUF1294 family)
MAPDRHRSSARQTFLLIALVLIIGVGLVLTWITTWQPYWIWLATTSIVTFFLYGYDKNQARSGGIRVPEAILHSMALFGGFLGGWLGMFVFHHKTRKPIFKIVLGISTILHALLIYWVYLRT